jgi:alcohol dehydrogenase, propanol-preferring
MPSFSAVALAAAGKIEHTITTLKLDDINDRVSALSCGDVVGRQVVVFG